VDIAPGRDCASLSLDPLVRVHRNTLDGEPEQMSAADDNRRMSRRAWFSRVLAPLKPVAKKVAARTEPEVAVIAARSCLPYQGTACTMCSDQCPVPGAIAFEEGYPVIVPEICTGCRICHDVCPAPVNAILMIPRRTPPAAVP